MVAILHRRRHDPLVRELCAERGLWWRTPLRSSKTRYWARGPGGFGGTTGILALLTLAEIQAGARAVSKSDLGISPELPRSSM
jgi:hypothetical protein